MTDAGTLVAVAMLAVGYVASGMMFFKMLVCANVDPARAKRWTWGLYLVGAFLFPIGFALLVASVLKLWFCRGQWDGPLSKSPHREHEASKASQPGEKPRREPSRRPKRKPKSRSELPPLGGSFSSFGWGGPKLADWSGTRELEFTYRNSKGERRDRRVSLKKVYTDGGVSYLVGYCHLRRALRTFRADRVKGKVVDLETGEVGRLADLFEVQ